MRRKLFFWELGGFLFTGALGVLLHFVYEWSGGSALAACVSAVNESTWEHMKLLFVPVFLFSLVQICLMGRNYPNLPAVRALSVLTGLTLIPVLFYTYTGALGCHVTWVDIAIFFAADLGAFALDFRLLSRGGSPADGRSSWGWRFCGDWLSVLYGVPSGRSACRCGGTR